ncbi:hypothetical protein D7Y15_42600 [Corallococcus sp. AB030]|uniref:Uncharacterized protein n=2 Tax=Myxococcaceae TaxID=31 RepID=A0A7X5BW56_9BACT|nr:hypothetical protein [Corallococcus exiguus]RKH16760.1 hypothetical protein D7V77_36775 [Corallococcus sp. CA041A]RKH94525.1 hypothetical protein D7Y15_42600 [Corallococcus sp. AB030]RUO87184.1 hypothetical protein D7Y11_42040 [Corallococcus sp. AB018]NBC42977.1 hypothetical protein [Corallococcus exiguus]TNV53801.1 hypothetical protein FH620_34640 [Corallococcus exiguus]
MGSTPINGSAPRVGISTTSAAPATGSQALVKQENLLRSMTDSLAKGLQALQAKSAPAAGAAGQTQSAGQSQKSAQGDKPTAEQAIQGLAEKYKDYVGSLGEKAGTRALDKAQKTVADFIAKNPNASAEEINKEAEKAFNKETSSEYIFKSVIEKSMSDTMAKVQERIDEAG